MAHPQPRRFGIALLYSNGNVEPLITIEMEPLSTSNLYFGGGKAADG